MTCTVVVVVLVVGIAIAVDDELTLLDGADVGAPTSLAPPHALKTKAEAATNKLKRMPVRR